MISRELNPFAHQWKDIGKEEFSMYTVILTAPSLCLFTMKPEIKEETKVPNKPTPRDIEILTRDFALRHNV